MRHHVFISYSRADGAWTGALATRLGQFNRRIWIDQRELQVSVDWADEVRDAITESSLVVLCDSPAWRVSTNCNAERTLAEQSAKPCVRVIVGDEVDAAAGEVQRALTAITTEQDVRTDLAILARDWERRGRPRGQLVGPAAERRLRASATNVRPPTAVEQAFLDAGVRRFRIRLLLSVIATLIVAVSVLALLSANTVIKRVGSNLSASLANEQSSLNGASAVSAARSDPYQALTAAAALGSSHDVDAGRSISSALNNPVPDDAFTVPAGADRFLNTPIGKTVIVAADDGTAYERAADATTIRAASPATSLPGHATGTSATSDLSVRVVPETTLAQIARHGRLLRTVDFGLTPTHLSLSPDGRELAGSFDGTVELIDVALGTEDVLLRGAPGPIQALAWGADGTHVWALTPGRVVGWTVQPGQVLADRRGTEYTAVLPASDGQHAWLVTAEGALNEVSLSTGDSSAEIPLSGPLGAAAASPDGHTAVIDGPSRAYIVSLATRAIRTVPIDACSATRPAFIDDTTVLIPCDGGDLLQLSTATGTVVRRIALSTAGASAVTVLPASHTAVAADRSGDLFLVAGSGVRSLLRALCGGQILALAASPAGGIAAVGVSTGQTNCSPIGAAPRGAALRPQAWRWRFLGDLGTGANVAHAVTFDDTGTLFAEGFDDGAVIVHPTGTLVPDELVNGIAGPIRDMLVTADDHLVVATGAGVVESISLCPGCLTDAAQAQLAAARVSRAKALGITH
jgi:hypothetical protein